LAVEVNSPDPAEVDLPAEVDPLARTRPPLEAACALGAPCEREEEEVDEDDLCAKARSGPNSRLALLTDVSANADVEEDWPDAPPFECPAPDTAPVSR